VKVKSIFLLIGLLVPQLLAAGPHFEKRKIKLNKTVLQVEIADTPEKSAQGLMYRKSLAEDQGMLFVFKDVVQRHFWMKNTFVPLSIGFFDENRALVDIQDMEPVKSEMETSPPTYDSAKPAKYCLEVSRGWFGKHNIKIGDHFEDSH
jgi:uncharacterized protein